MEAPKAHITHSYSCGDLQVHKAFYEEGCVLGDHFHEESRFVVVSQGSFVETTRSMPPKVCRNATLIFRAAGERHGNAFLAGTAACIVIKLGSSWVDRIFPSLLPAAPVLFCESPRVAQLAFELNSELVQCDHATPLAIESIVLELAVQAHRLQNQRSSPRSSQWLNALCDRIDQSFPKVVTLSDLAAEVSIHPVHILRTFRKRFGCTPAEYQRRKRMIHACHLLVTTDRSLVEISQTCGFSDQSHFARLFRHYTGTSPALFRKNPSASKR